MTGGDTESAEAMMRLVRFALEQHAAQADDAPLVVWEKDGERRQVRLPRDADPKERAADVLARPSGTWPPLRRSVVVWREELGEADGRSMPVRYACAHIEGDPASDLVIQHYTSTEAGEQPLGEPEMVDLTAPLTRRKRSRQPKRGWRREDASWWRTSRTLVACLGILGGIAVADFAVWAADRFGSATVHNAVIIDTYVEGPGRHDGQFHISAETASGERIDFAYVSGTEWLYDSLSRGQQVQVTLSDLTGRPVAVDTASEHFNLVANRGARMRAGASAVVLAVAAAYIVIASARTRRWGILGAVVACMWCGMLLLGIP